MAADSPSAKTPDAKPKRRLHVRIARGFVWVLLSIIGISATLLLLALLALRTSFVEEKLAGITDTQVKKALAGNLKLGRIELRGALSVCVRNVDLSDPEGVPAIRAKSICVTVEPLAFLHKGIHAQSVSLDTPEVFLTTVPGEDGKPTFSLLRALAPREKSAPQPPSDAPFAWAISVDKLNIKDGSFEMRDAPNAEPKLAVHGVQLSDTNARYSAGGAAAKLSLSGALKLEGEEKAQVSLDATLDGAVTSGRLALRSLEAHLGSSGFKAEGALDLTALSGALHLHDLLIEPADLSQLLGDLPLSAELKGEAEVTSDGKLARAAIHVETVRGGHINITAQTTIAPPPQWNVKVETEHVDPAFLVRGGPEGRVSLGLTLEGKGLPTFDDKGIEGDVRGALHLGPAQLKATGELSADAEFSLQGRSALVRKLDADALAVHVRANGSASLKELQLDLQVNATDLSRFAKSLGALQRKKPPALSGSAQLTAHVTGSPENPNAQLHLKSPALALGAGLRVSGLQVDGSLSGPLKRPRGTLTINSSSIFLSGIGLGAPKILAQVEWPKAHLQVDANVGGSRGDVKQEGGAIHLAGDAQVDEDADGAVLSGFQITWPGNELLQTKPTRLHFRPTETVLEPLLLEGKRGNISLSAIVKPPPPPLAHKQPGPAHIDSQLALEKFELGGLPAFVLPPDFHLGGSIDLHAQMDGTVADPDLKATLLLHSVEVQALRGLDGDFAAQLEHDRLRANGRLEGVAGSKLALRANIPVEVDAADSAPVDLDLTVGPLDLSKVPELIQRQAIFLAKPSGMVTLHVTAQGTLEKPRAQAVLEVSDFAWKKFHGIGLHAQLTADAGKANLEADLSLAKKPAATVSAELPFDLTANLRKPSLFAHVLERAAQVKLRITSLPLQELAAAGVLPDKSSGEVTAQLELSGTEALPQLSLTATGKQLTVGALHQLDVALHLSSAQKFHLDIEGKPGGEANAKLSLDVQVAAAELVAAARKGFVREALTPLLNRTLALQFEVEKLVLGKLAQSTTPSTGQSTSVTGELNGKISGSGTPNAPELKGNLTLRDIVAGVHELGDAEIYFEGNKDGATAHLGLAPPSGQELLAAQAQREKDDADRAANERAAAKAKPAPPGGGMPDQQATSSEVDGGTPLANALGSDQQAKPSEPGARENASGASSKDAAGNETQTAAAVGTNEAEMKNAEAKVAAAKAVPKSAGAKRADAAAAAEKESAKEADAAKTASAKTETAKSGMTQRGGGTFIGHATLQAPLSASVLLDQGIDAIEEGNLEGSVSMRNLDLTFLSGLSPMLRSTGGVIDGDIEMRGLLDRPELTGEAHLRGGAFDVVGQGIFNDVSLDATFTPQEIVLDRVSGSSSGGTFSGTLVLDRHNATSDDEDDQYQFSGELHAGDEESVRDRTGIDGKPLIAAPVPLRQAGEVRGDLAAEVDFFGDDTAGNVTAQVKIPTAKVRVASLPDKKLPSLSPNPEIFVFRKGEVPHPAGIDTEELKKQKAAMAASNLRIDVRLELEKLQVSANDFDFPVTSKMHASWEAQHPDEPSADGTVEVKGGTFSALGRRFSIDEAKITETGGDIADPELEIQARYENAQASVLVLVSGTAKDPQIDLSSSPPMDQDSIAFFLATGRIQGQATQQGSGVDLGNAATSVLGAMLFGKLRSNMADIMPVDVIDIEAGGGDRPPEASVGKYIGDRIFVGYRQRFSPAPTENENEVTVEYAIERGLGTSATVGDKNQGVMVTWTKDF